MGRTGAGLGAGLAVLAVSAVALPAAAADRESGPPEATSSASRVHIPACGNSAYGARIKPRSWNPGCAGSSPQFQNLRWSGWGRRAARGYGSARICTAGSCQTMRGKIIATRIRRCEGPKTTVRMYTRTTLRVGSRVYRQPLVCQ